MELTELKGIGEKTAVALNRLGIFCAEDLVYNYPRDYETYEVPKNLYELAPGNIETVEGVLSKDATINRFNGLTIVNAYLQDMTGKLQLSWYNIPYIKGNLQAGAYYIFRGRVYEKNGRLIMSQPKMYKPEDYHERFEGRLLPVYPLTKGVTNSLIVKITTEALKNLQMSSENNEYLDDGILMHEDLMDENEALIRIHFPRSRSELMEARQRIVFDEFFLFLVAGAFLKRSAESTVSAYRIRPDFRIIRFIADLPYELTKGQQDAYKAIVHDMSSGKVMQRLIEGDVGSGKTIVAVLAMINVALNGFQAAMMAPTEVLAIQHYETINRLLKDSGLPVETILLTGSMTGAEKRETYGRIASGDVGIIIGTHALFQEKAEFNKLALVVTDEQHRFGVNQRDALSSKGGIPHTLLMSATPIPRTLAIILYGDLDISVIDVLPEGRLPIKNCVVNADYRKKAYKFIYDEIKKGHQAYIICPAIEDETEKEDGAVSITRQIAEPLENVTDYTEKLRKLFPSEIRIEALHGRMKSEDKDSVMTAMKNGDIDILVSTTVVEVGVDVPNATVMMIENAERFGLAQLHQLRGRVGRGNDQSYCIMINTSDSDKAAERLDILNHSNDGFYIAEEDLRLRGPGDIFGIRQSGELAFRMADIYSDSSILKAAREVAADMLSDDPYLREPEHAGIKKRLEGYLNISL